MWIRGRLRQGRANNEDEFQLDLTKDHVDNVRDILSNICKKQGTSSERRKLSYLNAFVKLLTKCEHNYAKLGFTAEEILYCLRPALLHETTQVRTGGLGTLRYMLHSRNEAAICVKLQYPYLVARSMDLIVGSENERVQASRVVRRLLCLDAAQFPYALARSLVAIASGTEDPLINVALGTLAELCVLNPDMFIAVGGVTTVIRSLPSVKSARMAEVLVGSLLYLQNKPGTRQKSGLSLDCLAAPYTDLQPAKDSQGSDRLKWPHVTLLSTLRSWPGVLNFCHPLKDGLRSIVATLYLNQLDVRKAILDLLYELLCLAQPEWSDEMSVALEAVDPSRPQDSFKLSEGFVAAEGKSVLPNLSMCRVNLSELHLAMLLYCFLEVGLLDAIVEVIISEDTFLSVRATILLGELLHLTHLLLPPECCHLTPSLPNLLSYAVRGRPQSSPNRPGYFYASNETETLFESYNLLATLPSKKDVLTMLLGVPIGEKSAQTVSESFNEKCFKPEVSKRNTNEDNTSFRTYPKGLSDHKENTSDQTSSHLLKDVREVLADMSNMEMPRHTQSGFNVGSCTTPLSEPPPCNRAQQRALAAVMALSRLHRVLRRRPAPATIYLDHVLASVNKCPTLDSISLARVKGRTMSRTKLLQALVKECDEAIKDSQVLSAKDYLSWNWDTIRAILKSRPECLLNGEESIHRQFMRQLVQFAAPASRQMSVVYLTTDRRTVNHYTLTMMELFDCLLLGPPESECSKLLSELLVGLKEQIDAITNGKSHHDCLFNPQALTNTLCQDYFLLIGHLSRFKDGCDLLDKLGILHSLLVLSMASKHDCYVKLVISCLDYSSDHRTRNIMASTLVCPQVSSRLYATKFLRILLRTPLNKHDEDYGQWVVELLANQLSDKNRAVSLAAVSALDEACDCQEYLNALINLRPSLLHLGDKGLLLLIRFLSTETGFHYMSEANFVATQLTKWVKFNLKYVCIVEGELADGMTLVERNEDGRYSSRLSHTKCVPSDVYVPPHLYGQLAQHSAGLNTLLADDNVSNLVQVVTRGQCCSDSEILELKAALWALGHLSSCPGGAVWARTNSVTKAMVRLACSCPVIAVRATAFHAIALTSTNTEGADTLRALGWHTVRHDRSQHWPVVPPLSMLEDALLHCQEDTVRERGTSESTTDTVTKSGLFILGEDLESDENSSLMGFPECKVTARERKAATLPPTGSSHNYHHNRSYSESKADSDWAHSTTPAPSHSGSDITDFRGHGHVRLYSESSTSGTSSCGESCQPRTNTSERLTQTLSTIPSAGSLATTNNQQRRISVASSQGLSVSPKDMAGFVALQSLHRSRRPSFFSSPIFSLPTFSQNSRGSVSPISPIELVDSQDWNQISPLGRSKLPDMRNLEPHFEVMGVNCTLPYEPQTSRPLQYESSRSCIAQSPYNSTKENSNRPCYQGICLPQNLVDLFLIDEVEVNRDDPLHDNFASCVDGSSCDSETDTAGEGEGESGLGPRRHHHSNCLLCCVSRITNQKNNRWRKISASSQHRTRTETESSCGAVGNEGESPVPLAWHIKGGLEGITGIDSTSTDITSLTQRSLGDAFKSRSTVIKEVLRLTEQMCNPILYKTCKQSLLQFKQMYGDVFNDICVYSDVCSIMASAQHRIQARRILQELFLDAPFSELYEDPLGILTVQSNAEGDDSNGPCVDKHLIGYEAAAVEDFTSEVSTRKVSAPKMNGFDSDQRITQGHELEVILENDARSETSEMGRGSGENGHARSSVADSGPVITVLHDSDSRECNRLSGSDIGECINLPLITQENVLSQCQQSEIGLAETEEAVILMQDFTLDSQKFQENVLCSTFMQDVIINGKDRMSISHPSETDLEQVITVSKSSQQLKKDFFGDSLSPELSSNLEKCVPTSVPTVDSKSFGDSVESFASKVTDSITKSQNMLETKLQLDPNCITEVKIPQKVVNDQLESLYTLPGPGPNKAPEKDCIESTKRKVPSLKCSGSKLEREKHRGSDQNIKLLESTTVNRSPKVNNKSKLININTSSVSDKSHGTLLTDHCSLELPHSSKDVTLTVKAIAKLEPDPVKKDKASMARSQNVQRPSESPVTKGKPPLGRQRKKPVTKTPNKASLEDLQKEDL